MHSIQTQRHTLNRPLWVARNYQCLLIPWSNPLKSRVRFVKEGLVTEPIAFMRSSCVERKLLNIHLRSKSHEVIGRSSCGVRIYVHVPIKKIYIFLYQGFIWREKSNGETLRKLNYWNISRKIPTDIFPAWETYIFFIETHVFISHMIRLIERKRKIPYCRLYI